MDNIGCTLTLCHLITLNLQEIIRIYAGIQRIKRPVVQNLYYVVLR